MQLMIVAANHFRLIRKTAVTGLMELWRWREECGDKVTDLHLSQ